MRATAPTVKASKRATEAVSDEMAGQLQAEGKLVAELTSQLESARAEIEAAAGRGDLESEKEELAARLEQVLSAQEVLESDSATASRRGGRGSEAPVAPGCR